MVRGAPTRCASSSDVPRRPHAELEQPVDCDRTADLVAMSECEDGDVWTGLSALEGRDVVDPGIALAIGLDVGRGQLDGIGHVGHGAAAPLFLVEVAAHYAGTSS